MNQLMDEIVNTVCFYYCERSDRSFVRIRVKANTNYVYVNVSTHNMLFIMTYRNLWNETEVAFIQRNLNNR